MDKWEYGEKYGFHKEVEEPTESTLTERLLESENEDLRKENEELRKKLKDLCEVFCSEFLSKEYETLDEMGDD